MDTNSRELLPLIFDLYILVISFRIHFLHTTFPPGAFLLFDLLLHDNYRHLEILFTQTQIEGIFKSSCVRTAVNI